MPCSGGVICYPIIADTRADDIGIDTSECYVIEVNPQQIPTLSYSTKTQSGVKMQSVDKSATQRYYYVSAAESPTSIWIPAGSSSTASYAIKSITDDSGKEYTSTPRGTSLKTSDMTIGKPLKVNSDNVDKVMTSTLTVNVADDPTNIIVELSTSNYTVQYKASDFTSNRLQVKYDPNRETTWYVYDGRISTGYKPFMAKRDGNRLSTSMIFRRSTDGTNMGIYAYPLNLTKGSSGHTISVYANPIPCNVPVRFEFENTTGNEQNPDYLTGMVEAISVDGKKLTDKSWLKSGFTVPNGSSVSLYIKSQMRGVWEWESTTFNGTKLSSSGQYCDVEAESASETQVFKIRGIYNSPWRYTLKLNDPTHTKVMNGYSEINIPEGATTYEGTGSYSAPALKPMGRNSETEENPVVVTEVEVDGKKIALDADGCYTPSKMDEVITISTTSYKREVPVSIFLNSMGYEDYYILLDPRGQTRKKVILKDGWQTVYVNPKDMPLACRTGSPAVYLNGSTTACALDEYGYVQGLEKITANSKLKIYPYAPTWRTVTTKIESGVSCTITADDETVTAGTKSYPEGTVLKFTPTQKTGLVIEDQSGTVMSQASDGTFTITVEKANTYTLHKKNAEITINGVTGNPIRMENVGGPTKTMDFTAAGGTFTFPYVEGSNGSYSARFSDPKNEYKVSAITASPSTGFSYDASTYTATGIKDGMTLTLTVVKEDKPYTLTLHIPPIDEDNREYGYTNHTVAIKYMSGGKETVQTLQHDMVFKMGLSADNFPITLGGFILYNGEIQETELPQSYLVYLGETCNQIGDYYGNEVTFDTPQSLTGCLIFANSRSAYCKIYNRTKDLCYYSILGNYSSYLYSGNSDEWSFEVRPGSVVSLQVDKTSRARFYNNQYDKSDCVTYLPDEDGYINIKMPWTDEFGFDSKVIEVETFEKSLYFEEEDDFWFPSEQILKANGQSYYPAMMGVDPIAVCDTIQLTSIVSYQGDRVITGVYESTSGKVLPFDPETGVITGLREFYDSDDYDEIVLKVYSEPLDRSKKLNIVKNGTNFNGLGYILSDNSLLRTEGSFTGDFINYGSVDEPIRLSVHAWKYAIGSNKKTYTYGKVYLNGSPITEKTITGYDYKLFELPTNIPDGSVVRLFSAASTGNVTYNVSDGINVNIYHDAEAQSDFGSTFTLAKGTVIKIEPADGNGVEYRVVRNGVRMSAEEAAKGIAVANATESIVIEPATDELTFNAGTDTDLTKLNVTDNLNNPYSLSGNSAKVSFRGDVTSMNILNTDPDYYISSVTTDPSSIKYDVATGELTNLTTGSLTIISKQLERKNEVDIYVDGSELEGAELTLGNGKVIETGQALTNGSQTIQFAEEDLPIIFKLPDSYLGEGGTVPTDPSKMPTVIVNGQTLTYSAEHGGYVFPVEAFSDPSNPPVIKIYPAEPEPTEITFMVESGVNFSTVVDGDTANAYTEATTISLLPGSNVAMTAKSSKNGEEIYLEKDGETIQEGTDISYNFTVGNEEQTFAFKRKKVAVTVKNEDAWRTIHVSGAGLTYPMYDAASELEFPVGTTELSLRSSSDTQRVAKVTNATTGAVMNFDPVTGVVTGVSDQMKLNIEMGDLVREKTLTVYSEEGADAMSAIVKIASGKAVEKSMYLVGGYQTMKYDDSDLPVAVKSDQKLAVYMNNEPVAYNNGEYNFSEQLPENPVLKVFSAEQPTVNVTYKVDQEAFKAEITHDHVSVIDHTQAHELLPGTEIVFTLDYLNPETAKLVKARREAVRAAAAEGRSFSKEDTEVTVNGEALVPQEDDIFVYKVLAEDAAEGLKFVVKRPDYVDESTGITYSGDRKTVVSVSPDAPSPVVIPEGVTTIGEGAFKGCDKITSVALPSTLTTIEKEAFTGSGLTTVQIPDNVTTIGEGAFKDCDELETVVLGKGLEEVDQTAFEGCESLGKSMYPETLGKSPFPSTVPAVPYDPKDELTVDENGYITAAVKDEKGNVVGKKLVSVPVTAGTGTGDGDEGDGTFTLPTDVTEIGPGAFTGCDNITKLVLPEGSELTGIGEGAFEGCTNLTSVDLSGSNTLTEIGENAFKGTKITEIELPESLEKIGGGAFEGTDLTSVKIPDNVTEIGEGAFKGCTELETVVLGTGLKEVGEDAFEGCENLGKSLYPETLGKSPFPDTVPAVPYDPEDELEIDPETGIVTAPVKDEDGHIVGKKLVLVPTTAGNGEGEGEEKGTFTLPEGITEIGSGAFTGCDNIEKVIVPDGVDKIGNGAFEGLENLKEVDLSENKSLTEIGENAFKGTSITDIELPETLEKIGGGAFEGTDLKTVVVPDNVKEIGNGAFKDIDELENVVLGNGLDPEKTGENLFEGSENIKKAVYPDTLEEKVKGGSGNGDGEGTGDGDGSESNGMFPPTTSTVKYDHNEELEIDENGVITSTRTDEEGNTVKKLVSVPTTTGEGEGEDNTFTVPDDIDEIGEGAFKGCENIEKVVVPDGVDKIGNGAFEGLDNLKEVDLSGNTTLTEIGENAFKGTSITEIDLPDGLTTIGSGAFEGCDELEEIDIPETVTEIGEGALEGCTSLTSVTLPDGITEIGEGEFSGCENLTNVKIPETVTEIGNGAFEGCTNLENVEIPEGVDKIGENAFKGCENLTNVTLPENLTEIGNGAFEGCKSLTEVEVPENVEKVGENAFKGCENLTNVTLPENLTEIGGSAFEDCKSLTEVEVPENVDKVGENAFKGCENLTNVTLPDNLTEIGNGAFEGCTNLKNVDIPDGVEKIGENTFKGCENLTNVTLPDNLTEIGEGAFEGCKNLTEVDIPENVTEIGNGAFKGCESLTSIALPPTIDTVGEDAFEGCNNLTKCVYPDTLDEPFGEGVGVSYPADEAIVSEQGVIYTSETVYYAPSDVTEFKVPDTATSIIGNAFSGCTELKEVELPQTLTELGENAFAGCSSLTEITVPNRVTTIENGTFSGCSSLIEVNLGSAVNEIEEGAFEGCSSLNVIDLHSGVHSIGTGAFRNCGLTDIHLGCGIERIADNAFDGNNISEIAISAQSAPSLGENAFGGNTTARLLVQGNAAANEYRQAEGWNVFTPAQMVVATSLDSYDDAEIDINENDGIQLHVVMNPANATMGKIFWESTHPDHVTVDNKGYVTLNGSSSAHARSLEPREMTTITITAKTMYANGPVREYVLHRDISTGVWEIDLGETIDADELARLLKEGAVYTLGGLKVAPGTRSLDPGVYIVRTSGKSRKVVVK